MESSCMTHDELRIQNGYVINWQAQYCLQFNERDFNPIPPTIKKLRPQIEMGARLK